MTLLILFFILSIVFSFLCSVWEAVILSVTPTYIRRLTEEGNPLGSKLSAMKKDIDRPLSAILSLNTIAHTVGAIGVGAQAGKVFGTSAWQLGPISISGEAVVAGVMTLAILVLSEIIPKTLGASRWQSLAGFTVSSLGVVMTLMWPLVWLSERITRSIKAGSHHKSVLSRKDIYAIANESQKEGALAASESKIIRNLMQMDERTVKDIMTPRRVVLQASAEATVQEFYQDHRPLQHSRIPVYTTDKDHVVGIMLKDDLLEALAMDRHQTKVGSLVRKVHFIKDDLSLPALFDQLFTQRRHLAMVADDFGSILGLVTMEDLMETILGMEITDETDAVDDLQQLAQERWQQHMDHVGKEGGAKGEK